MKRIWLISILLGLELLTINSQDSIVTIPDTNFLNALIDEGIDTDEDGQISFEEAEAVTKLDMSREHISDMTGIVAFVNLDTLQCDWNQLTSLDVSNNTALVNLDCGRNQLCNLNVSNCSALVNLDCMYNCLSGLDVSNCSALKTLYCALNEMVGLDVSNCSALETLSCGDNYLGSLDVTDCIALTSLEVGYDYEGVILGNHLTTLDVSNNIALNRLICMENRLTSLDVSKNTALEYLNCAGNYILNLDVSNNKELTVLNCGFKGYDYGRGAMFGNLISKLDISKNNALEELSCVGNRLTTLDVSNNTALTRLECGYNQLISLDISNTSIFPKSQDTYPVYVLDISYMPSLQQVCDWELLVPAEVISHIDTTGSPNVHFTTECSEIIAPVLTVIHTLYQPDYVTTASSEDGMIYLVPEDTDKDIAEIRGVCIDSVVATANTPVNIPLSGLENGTYWLYAGDSTGNISEPEAFTIITGVAINDKKAEQIRIYPNPSQSLLTIETGISDIHYIEITSLNGQLLFSREMEGPMHQLDLCSFQSGVYFITIRSKDFVNTSKIIKL